METQIDPGLGRSPKEWTATHSSILAQRIPWTEKLTGYSPWGQQSDTSEEMNTHITITELWPWVEEASA